MIHYHNCCLIQAQLAASATRFQNIDESYMLHLRKVLFNPIYFVILNKPILGCRVRIYLNECFRLELLTNA